jgi:signal transduction histidine kinase
VLGAAASAVGGDPDSARVTLGRARELVDDALAELRALIFELRPPALESDGLAAAVRKHADVIGRAHGLAAAVRADTEDAAEDGRPAPGVESALFRVVQEALHNVVRHAGATSASVTIESDADAVSVVVEDDGIGFDPGSRAIASRRLGLVSMRERVAALGGEVDIVSSPGEGTTVRARVPRG